MDWKPFSFGVTKQEDHLKSSIFQMNFGLSPDFLSCFISLSTHLPDLEGKSQMTQAETSAYN